MISARVIKDSIGPSKVRLTTFVLTYPRYIHAEVMTHRMFSRNASSSSAIPVKKALAAIRRDMVVPIHIGANKAGMQADKEVSAWRKWLAVCLWKGLGHIACVAAWMLDRLGVHKQVVNRVTEPWSHITVVVTATDWANFLALRYHPAAQPEIQVLAQEIYLGLNTSTPDKLKAGEWHLPFVDQLEIDAEAAEPRAGVYAPIRRSVARCARVSYNNHDGTHSSLAQDTDLYRRLLGAQPIHASPAEHQARATKSNKYSGNLRGWVQYRKTLPNENVKTFTGPLESE